MTKKDTAAAAAEKNTPNTGETTGNAAPDAPLFKHDYLPEPPYGVFRKKVLTRATRIEGPFRVRTPEGELECADGWLALDESGAPYPISASEFEKLYEEHNPEAVQLVNHATQIDDNALRARRRAYRMRALAEDFTRALLSNPLVERFVYGNPLEAHTAGEHPSVGAFLAHRCGKLAEEYVVAEEQIDETRLPPDDEVFGNTVAVEQGANSAA